MDTILTSPIEKTARASPPQGTNHASGTTDRPQYQYEQRWAPPHQVNCTQAESHLDSRPFQNSSVVHPSLDHSVLPSAMLYQSAHQHQNTTPVDLPRSLPWQAAQGISYRSPHPATIAGGMTNPETEIKRAPYLQSDHHNTSHPPPSQEPSPQTNTHSHRWGWQPEGTPSTSDQSEQVTNRFWPQPTHSVTQRYQTYPTPPAGGNSNSSQGHQSSPTAQTASSYEQRHDNYVEAFDSGRHEFLPTSVNHTNADEQNVTPPYGEASAYSNTRSGNNSTYQHIVPSNNNIISIQAGRAQVSPSYQSNMRLGSMDDSDDETSAGALRFSQSVSKSPSPQSRSSIALRRIPAHMIEDKEERKKQQNRDSAKRFRERTKARLAELEVLVEEYQRQLERSNSQILYLQQENAELRRKNDQLRAGN